MKGKEEGRREEHWCQLMLASGFGSGHSLILSQFHRGLHGKGFKTERSWEEDNISDITTLNPRVKFGEGQPGGPQEFILGVGQRGELWLRVPMRSQASLEPEQLPLMIGDQWRRWRRHQKPNQSWGKAGRTFLGCQHRVARARQRRQLQQRRLVGESLALDGKLLCL